MGISYKYAWFDRCMRKCIIKPLQTKHVYFDSATLRWGFVGLASTIFLSIIAIGISLLALYETDRGGSLMSVLGTIGAIVAILALAFVFFFLIPLSIYFLRNMTTRDPTLKILRRTNRELNDMNGKLDRLTHNRGD